MNLRSGAFVFLTSLLVFSGCSVYKSSGRKSFESKASGNLQSGIQTSDQALLDSNVCWNQPASDPLWHVDAESHLIVSKLSDDEIQVCLQAP